MSASLELRKISIRGRQALGAVCFRRFCTKYEIHHPEIDAFVSHCFDLATARDLTAWERAGSLLTASGLGDPLPEAVFDVIVNGSTAKFETLLQEVTEIGYCDLYAAVSDHSRQHLLAVFNILEGERIPLPDVAPFSKSSFATGDGWGNVVAPELDSLWRSIR